MQGCDLVAEEPGRARAGMGDQGLVRRQIQLEFFTQERRQFKLDLFGLGFRSGEPEQVIVGLCRARDYADCGVVMLVIGGGRGSMVGIIPAL